MCAHVRNLSRATFTPVCGSLITIRLVNGKFHYFSSAKLCVHGRRVINPAINPDNAAAIINGRTAPFAVVNVKGKWHVRRQITLNVTLAFTQ